jgi:hypothetical protein
MTLSLYNYNSQSDIENVFSWEPIQNQWWITGFNPNLPSPDSSKMVVIGSVDFAGHEELYEALKATASQDNPDPDQKRKAQEYLMFDEEEFSNGTKECIVWIIWNGKEKK